MTEQKEKKKIQSYLARMKMYLDHFLGIGLNPNNEIVQSKYRCVRVKFCMSILQESILHLNGKVSYEKFMCIHNKQY